MFYWKLVRKLMSPDEGAQGGGSNDNQGGDPAGGKKPSDKKPEETDVVSLAKALKEARENSVPKSDYDKVVKEKEALVSDIINGGKAGSGQQEAPKEPDIEALKAKLYGPKSSELNNLEYWKTALELRNAVIKKDGVDPFLPHGANIKPTEFDAERAEAVATVVQECIDEAEGDSGVFTALLQSKINNDSQALTAHLKKMGLIK